MIVQWCSFTLTKQWHPQKTTHPLHDGWMNAWGQSFLLWISAEYVLFRGLWADSLDMNLTLETPQKRLVDIKPHASAIHQTTEGRIGIRTLVKLGSHSGSHSEISVCFPLNRLKRGVSYFATPCYGFKLGFGSVQLRKKQKLDLWRKNQQKGNM